MKRKNGNAKLQSPVLGEEPLKWSGTYTWRIKKFSKQDERKRYSPQFEVGGYFWRLLLFPKGNSTQKTFKYISFYLDFPEVGYTPRRMCPTARLELTAVKHANPSDSLTREATHTFTTAELDWGFTEFLSLQALQNPESGFLVNDVLTLRVNVFIQRADNLGAISKLQTGFLGIKSPEETSLLSSFMQCLYHIKALRKAIFRIPTKESDDPQKSLPLALQHLFYKLHYQNTSVKLKDLLKALDWNCEDVRLQYDVHEVGETLFGKLDEDIEASNAKDRILELLMGELSNYIQLPSNERQLTFKQSYIGITLNVLECKDIYDSLEKFCQIERLREDNHHLMASHARSESKDYVLFNSFPSVLLLRLRRSHYNPDRKVILKINSHYEFYDELDLDYKDRILLSESADKTIENKYRLHSVLFHADDSDKHGYFTTSRCRERWYKFDGEVVRTVSARDAIDAQFGDQSGTSSANFSNRFDNTDRSTAAMLVYIRKSEWQKVMCDAKKKCLWKSVRVSFDRQRIAKEERQKQKEDAHLYLNINLSTELHFAKQIGKTYYFDLVDFDAVKHYRVHKKTPFESFKRMVSKDFGIPRHLQRFWRWIERSNKTMRISEPLIKKGIDLKTVLDLGQFKEIIPPLGQEKTALMTINLFLESPEVGHRGKDDVLHAIQHNEVLVFIKYYDPISMELSYLGHLFIEKTTLFREIFETAKKMASLDPGEEVIGVQEVQHLPEVICADLLPDKTPEEAQVVQGDIIIIQKDIRDQDSAFLLVREFLESIQTPQEDESKDV